MDKDPAILPMVPHMRLQVTEFDGVCRVDSGSNCETETWADI